MQGGRPFDKWRVWDSGLGSARGCDTMDFGFSVPIGGVLATGGALASLARRGEELGFGFLSTGDHLIAPRQIRSRYPYSVSGEYGNALSFLDQPTLLSFVAAATSSIRLVTGVLVVPYRSPIHTAKVLATIDVLSGGRLTVGCGVGWMREEFEILDVPPFEERGAVTDEYIRVFRSCGLRTIPSSTGNTATSPAWSSSRSRYRGPTRQSG